MALRQFDGADGDLAAARIVLRVELHLLALMQALDASPLERGGVNEHVLRAAFGLNEAEALLPIVELHCAVCHGIVLSLTVCTWVVAHEISWPVSRFVDFGESETCAPVMTRRSGPVVRPISMPVRYALRGQIARL